MEKYFNLTLTIFITLIATFSLPVFSEPTWHTSKIERVYPLASGGFVLRFKNANSTCKNESKYHYVTEGKNGVTKEAISNLLSVALVAGTSEKELTINFENSSESCDISRLFIKF